MSSNEIDRIKSACLACIELKSSGLSLDDALPLIKRYWDVEEIKTGDRAPRKWIKLEAR